MSVMNQDVIRLRALAHPVRLGMMRQLAERPETCACDFTEVFAVSQPTISQHLKVLRDAGLVRTRRRGTQICYSIDAGALGTVRDVISALGRSGNGQVRAAAGRATVPGPG
jgi:ArsR family transcriptional regulator, arsenate/arsenite/antimonite-responsive transcriptional repressor